MMASLFSFITLMTLMYLFKNIKIRRRIVYYLLALANTVILNETMNTK